MGVRLEGRARDKEEIAISFLLKGRNNGHLMAPAVQTIALAVVVVVVLAVLGRKLSVLGRVR